MHLSLTLAPGHQPGVFRLRHLPSRAAVSRRWVHGALARPTRIRLERARCVPIRSRLRDRRDRPGSLERAIHTRGFLPPVPEKSSRAVAIDSSPRGHHPQRMNTERPGDWGSRNHIHVLELMAATALGIYLCYRMALPFMPPLTWALVLAVLFRPVHQWLASRVKRRTLAASLSVLLIGLIVFVPATFMGRRACLGSHDRCGHHQVPG